MQKSRRYRLLDRGEKMQVGDQAIGDDGETWVDLVGWEHGIEWDPVAFKTVRRPLQTDTK